LKKAKTLEYEYSKVGTPKMLQCRFLFLAEAVENTRQPNEIETMLQIVLSY
jgi:hypothetical protein